MSNFLDEGSFSKSFKDIVEEALEKTSSSIHTCEKCGHTDVIPYNTSRDGRKVPLKYKLKYKGGEVSFVNLEEEAKREWVDHFKDNLREEKGHKKGNKKGNKKEAKVKKSVKRKRWTPEDFKIAKDMFKEGATVKKVAEKLKRSQPAVQMAKVKMFPKKVVTKRVVTKKVVTKKAAPKKVTTKKVTTKKVITKKSSKKVGKN